MYSNCYWSDEQNDPSIDSSQCHAKEKEYFKKELDNYTFCVKNEILLIYYNNAHNTNVL